MSFVEFPGVLRLRGFIIGELMLRCVKGIISIAGLIVKYGCRCVAIPSVRYRCCNVFAMQVLTGRRG